LFVNLIAGAGVMYPPFFRQRARARLNRKSMQHLADVLQRKGWLVGFHPEGTRNKSDDPYTLLPMQPGASELALRPGVVVVPVFINGLGNSLVGAIKRGFGGASPEGPCICVFGNPLALDRLQQERLGPRAYKEAALVMESALLDLAAREREIRALCVAGSIAGDDPRWLKNLPGSKLYARRV
jgi:1-acyl-sn-glycerol-3-phosphate acyltransferase